MYNLPDIDETKIQVNDIVAFRYYAAGIYIGTVLDISVDKVGRPIYQISWKNLTDSLKEKYGKDTFWTLRDQIQKVAEA